MQTKIQTQQGLLMAVRGLGFNESRLHAFVTKNSSVKIDSSTWELVKVANNNKRNNVRA